MYSMAAHSISVSMERSKMPFYTVCDFLFTHVSIINAFALPANFCLNCAFARAYSILMRVIILIFSIYFRRVANGFIIASGYIMNYLAPQ